MAAKLHRIMEFANRGVVKRYAYVISATMALFWWPSVSNAYDPAILDAFAAYSLNLPSGVTDMCFCRICRFDRRTEVGLGPTDHRKLKALLSPGKASATAERAAIAAAIAWLDRRVGPELVRPSGSRVPV